MNVIPLSPAAAVLFCPWSQAFIGDGTLLVGKGVGVQCKAQTIVLIRKLRYLWDASLAAGGRTGGELLGLVTELLTQTV